jgi:hypothetical protein
VVILLNLALSCFVVVAEEDEAEEDAAEEYEDDEENWEGERRGDFFQLRKDASPCVVFALSYVVLCCVVLCCLVLSYRILSRVVLW